jgi:hypothetical protein
MTKYSPSRQCAFLGRAYRRAVAGVLRFDDAAGERDFIWVSCSRDPARARHIRPDRHNSRMALPVPFAVAICGRFSHPA